MALNLGSEQARYSMRLLSSSLEVFDSATVALQQLTEEKHRLVEESYCAGNLQVFEVQSREASSCSFLFVTFLSRGSQVQLLRLVTGRTKP